MAIFLRAKPDCCEEASPLSRERYVPCNAPATAVVHSDVDRRNYRMCAACADHNVRHRGMRFVRDYVVTPSSTITAPGRPRNNVLP